MILLKIFYIYLLVKLKVNCTVLKYRIFFYSIIKARSQIFVWRISETQVEIEMCTIPYEDKCLTKICFSNYQHFK